MGTQQKWLDLPYFGHLKKQLFAIRIELLHGSLQNVKFTMH